MGIFDSGVGGLTVAREIRNILPSENLVYFGDLLHLPYGSKSEKAVIQFSLAACDFLVSRKVKLLVIACNTATSLAKKRIEELFDIPSVGVIEPGARRACEVSIKKKIGVIGTAGTIESYAYKKAILKIDPGILVYQKATPLLVPLIEEGWFEHPVLIAVLNEYFRFFREKSVDTVVLGCTHYPLIKKQIQNCLQNVKIVDSAVSTALTTRKVLSQRNMRMGSEKIGSFKIYLTDLTKSFMNTVMNIIGNEKLDFKVVSSEYSKGYISYSI